MSYKVIYMSMYNDILSKLREYHNAIQVIYISMHNNI